MNLSELQTKSASPQELVLSLPDALAAIDLFERSGTPVLGWEGWLRRPDGHLGHSAQHQGAAVDGPISTVAEYAWVKRTMQDSQTVHDLNPEVPGSELLFCITAGG